MAAARNATRVIRSDYTATKPLHRRACSPYGMAIDCVCESTGAVLLSRYRVGRRSGLQGMTDVRGEGPRAPSREAQGDAARRRETASRGQRGRRLGRTAVRNSPALITERGESAGDSLPASNLRQQLVKRTGGPNLVGHLGLRRTRAACGLCRRIRVTAGIEEDRLRRAFRGAPNYDYPLVSGEAPPIVYPRLCRSACTSACDLSGLCERRAIRRRG